MFDKITDVREKVEEQAKNAGLDETVDSIREAGEPFVDRVQEYSGSRFEERVSELLGEDTAAVRALGEDIVAEYRENPQQAVNVLKDVVDSKREHLGETASSTARTVNQVVRDEAVQHLGYADFEEYRGAKGYAEPGMNALKDNGTPYDHLEDVAGFAVSEDELSRYGLDEIPDDLSPGSEGREQLEHALSVHGEARLRQDGIDAECDGLLYTVSDETVRVTAYRS